MIVASTITNAASRPRQRRRDSAYATGIDDSTTPSVDRIATVIVFAVYRSTGIVSKTSAKFDHRNGLGHSSVVRACSVVMSDVSVTKTSGIRKIVARVISTAWFATAMRNRRRRIATGVGRRSIAA